MIVYRVFLCNFLYHLSVKLRSHGIYADLLQNPPEHTQRNDDLGITTIHK